MPFDGSQPIEVLRLLHGFPDLANCEAVSVAHPG